MAAVRHLRFIEIQIFNRRCGSQGKYASQCQISCRSVKPLPFLLIFQMAAVRHFELLKVGNFYCFDGADNQHESSCKILRRSVKPLPRYNRFCFWRWHKLESSNFVYMTTDRMCQLLAFGWQATRGQSHVTLLEFWSSNHILGIGNASTSILCAKRYTRDYYSTHDILSQGIILGSRDVFKFWEISDDIWGKGDRQR